MPVYSHIHVIFFDDTMDNFSGLCCRVDKDRPECQRKILTIKVPKGSQSTSHSLSKHKSIAAEMKEDQMYVYEGSGITTRQFRDVLRWTAKDGKYPRVDTIVLDWDQCISHKNGLYNKSVYKKWESEAKKDEIIHAVFGSRDRKEAFFELLRRRSGKVMICTNQEDASAIRQFGQWAGMPMKDLAIQGQKERDAQYLKHFGKKQKNVTKAEFLNAFFDLCPT